MNPWIGLLGGLAFVLVSDTSTAVDVPPPFEEIARADGLRPAHASTRVVDGQLVFSRYAPSGNAFDIVAADPDTLVAEPVVRERRGARLIARNSRFLVIQQEGDVARPVVVLDTASQAELARVRLRSIVTWGQIRGDRLLLIQGDHGAGHASAVPALIYSLPTLRLLRSITIAGGNDVQSWGDLIVSLGREITIYDMDFRNIGSLPLPKPRIDRNVRCAARGPLHIAKDRAVVAANCGNFHVFDLKTRSLERIIPGFSHFYQADVIDGVLFAAAANPNESRDTRALELASGKLLAVLPIEAAHGLLAVGSRLIAVHPSSMAYGRATIRTFEMNIPSLHKGDWRAARVAKACQEARVVAAESDDIYRAIDLCRGAGIEGFIGDEALSSDTRALLRDYATWLSRTFDQAAQAERILRWLAVSGTPGADLSAARAEAGARMKTMAKLGRAFPADNRRKSDFEQKLALDLDQALGKSPFGTFDLDDAERKSELGRAIRRNRSSIRTRAVTMSSDYYPELMDPDGEHLYSHRYGCTIVHCADTGPSVVVYDRGSLQELAAIAVVPFDDDHEDFIQSIAVDERYLYASIGYQGGLADRTNFVVIDKASRSVARSGHIDVEEASLTMSHGELLACSCRSWACHAVDVESLQTEKRSEYQCPGGTPQGSESEHYAATREFGWSGMERWRFTAKAGGSESTVFEIPSTTRGPLLQANSPTAVFIATVAGTNRVLLADIRTGTQYTLLGLPAVQNVAPPHAALIGSTLVVSYGRDLLLWDLRTRRLREYIPDFIQGDSIDSDHRPNAHQVVGLHVADGRLVVRTRGVGSTTIVNIADLLQ